MSEKFKAFVNKFSKLFQGNKKFSKKSFLMAAVVVLFIAVSVSVPIYQAHANFLVDGLEYILDRRLYIILDLIYAFLFLVLNLFLDLSVILVMFGAWLIDAVMEPALYVGDAANPGVLTSSTVDIGWKTVRDMCNTFYLFFLLIIAFGTILRSSTFNAKNLLPKLVISLFLINFSAEITKLVIDFGQVFMYEIRSWMGSFGEGAGSLTSIVDQFRDQLNNFGSKPSFEKVVQVTFALVYSLALGFIYIMLAMFLLIRLIAFVLLIILSPIAFLSIAMPSMAKYTSRWWSELVKYSIFGPIFMFFVYLSATMANELITNYTPVILPGSGFGVIETFVGLIFPHLIALIMLCAVIPVTQELGMAGSNKIIGGAGGIGKVAMGTYAGVKLAGGLGRRAGGEITKRSDNLSKGVEGTKQWGYNRMGKIPGFQGAALKGKASIEKKREDRLKKMEMDFGDLKSIDLKLLEEKANSKLGTTDDKALLLKAAAAQGKLGDPKYEDYLKGAEASMSKKDLDETTDKNLSMATMTNEAKTRSTDSFSQDAQGRMSRSESTRDDEIRREKVSDLEKEGKINQIQDLDSPEIAKAVYKNLSLEGKKKAINSMPKDQQDKWAKGLGESIQLNHLTLPAPEQVENSKMVSAKTKLDGKLKLNLDKASLTGGDAVDETKKIIAELNTNQISNLS
ncbi:hypothetical protein GQ568_00290, partial [Patescibacteria group bacterium]|nr:hypothetical protein [Patescibacteria group bacterium]